MFACYWITQGFKSACFSFSNSYISGNLFCLLNYPGYYSRVSEVIVNRLYFGRDHCDVTFHFYCIDLSFQAFVFFCSFEESALQFIDSLFCACFWSQLHWPRSDLYNVVFVPVWVWIIFLQPRGTTFDYLFELTLFFWCGHSWLSTSLSGVFSLWSISCEMYWQWSIV